MKLLNYKDAAAEQVAKTLGYVRDEAGWKVAKKSDQTDDEKCITIWYKPSTEFDGNVYKSEGIVEANPEQVFKLCDPKPGGLRCTWDKAIKDLQTVEQIFNESPEIFILRTMTHTAAMGMISGRDFVDLVVNASNDDFLATVAHSIDSDKAPVSPDFVRGKNFHCGIFCCRIPGDPSRTRVFHVSQSDIGGMVPRALVESSLPSAIMDFYLNLRKAAEQADNH